MRSTVEAELGQDAVESEAVAQGHPRPAQEDDGDRHAKYRSPYLHGPRLPNDLPFSSERQGRVQAYHGREEPRAQPAASRHEPPSSGRAWRSAAATACSTARLLDDGGCARSSGTPAFTTQVLRHPPSARPPSDPQALSFAVVTVTSEQGNYLKHLGGRVVGRVRRLNTKHGTSCGASNSGLDVDEI